MINKSKRIGVVLFAIVLVMSISLMFVGFTPKVNEDRVNINILLNEDCLTDYYNESNGSFNEFLDNDKTKEIEREILDKQNQVFNDIKKQCNNVDFIDRSTKFSNSITCKMTPSDARKIKHDSIRCIQTENYISIPEIVEDTSLKPTIEKTKKGVFDSSKLDVNGEGMLIGIIDCGVEIGHEAFSTMPTGNVKYKDNSYLTDELLSQLHAKASRSDLYKNQKIVYAYDYVENDTDATNSSDDWHGTHVAGIAAGNNGKDFYGASPNAQLAVFKVFGNRNMGAYTHNMLKAVEDALLLGCDVINMSLGGPALYKVNAEFTEVFKNAKKLGMAIVISNGNEGASLKYDPVDYTSSDFVDISAASSPASEHDAMGVGNCEADLSKMHFSSSWGALPTFEIKPDITTPGTDVLSSVTTKDNKVSSYDTATGTSMAAPNFSATIANMMEYISLNSEKFNYPSPAQRVTLAENILMSNADPIKYMDAYYSPRHQGSGVADYYDIEKTKFMMSTLNNGRPKISLGEDEAKTGKYQLSFNITSFADSLETIELNGAVQTDLVDGDGKLTLLPKKLNADVKFYKNHQEIANLEINPKEIVTIDVVITLPESVKGYLDQTFINGAYVEGYIFATSGDSDMSLPFLVYYGDYEDPNMFYSMGSGEPVIQATSQLYGAIQDVKLGKFMFDRNRSDYTYESNYYLDNSNNKLAFNPKYTRIFIVQYRLLRDSNYVKCIIKNAETGDIFYSKLDEEIYAKWQLSYNFESYAKFKIPTNLNQMFANLHNNERLELTLEGNNAFIGNDPQKYVMYITIDYESPVLQYAKLNGNNLEIRISDNHYIQGYNIIGKTGSTETKLFNTYKPVFQKGAGQVISLTNDVTRLLSEDDIFVDIIDYAGNSQRYNIKGMDKSSKWEVLDNLYYSSIKNINLNFSSGEFEDGKGGKYKTLDNGFVLTEYTGNSEEYSVIDGTVTIKDDAFNEKVRVVTMPKTLKTLNTYAFNKSINLKKIIFTSYNAPSITKDKKLNCDIEVPYYNVGYSNNNYYSIFNGISKLNNFLLKDRFKGDVFSDDPILPIPSKAGYNFVGWFNETNQKVTSANPGDVLEAKYEPIKGVVNIIDNNNTYKYNYEFGQKIHLTNSNYNKYKTVYKIKVNGEFKQATDDMYFMGDNLDIEYIYEDTKFDVRIHKTNKEFEDVLLDKNDVINIPERDGYKFEGWYIDKDFSKEFDKEHDLNQDLNLYAKWAKNEETIINDNVPNEDNNGLYIGIGVVAGLVVIAAVVFVILKKRKKKYKGD